MNRFHYLAISLTAFSLLVFRMSTPAANDAIQEQSGVEDVLEQEIDRLEATRSEIDHDQPLYLEGEHRR
ncbi:MAG: hypothetical protein WA952_17780 [Lewinella sp.]